LDSSHCIPQSDLYQLQRKRGIGGEEDVIRIQTDLDFLCLAGKTCSARPLGGHDRRTGATTSGSNVAKSKCLVKEGCIKEEERGDTGFSIPGTVASIVIF
jgi:hypothetical protein